MEAIFVKLVNMSINAGWLILAVLALRLIFRKSPKWIFCALWGLVAFRLICPFSPESDFSLLPSSEVLPLEIVKSATPQIQSGIGMADAAVNPVLAQTMTADPSYSANPLQIWSFVLSYVWLIGMVLMLLYALGSFLLLRHRLATATLYQKDEPQEAAGVRSAQSLAGVHTGKQILIKQSEHVEAAFVLGFIRPVIYLPYQLPCEDMEYVVAHERAHIARGDHWWKLIGFLLLSVYWFHPLVWAAYFVFGRDVEAACDERVIRYMETDKRRAYSTALLHCSLKRHRTAPCPLAFGEVGVKERIKNVMHYKKPALWMLATTLTACVAVAVCLLTDPKETVAEDAYWRLEIDDYVVALVDKEPEETRRQTASEAELEIRVYRDDEQWSLKSFTYDRESVSAARAAENIKGEPVADILGFDGFQITYLYSLGSTGSAVFCEVDYYTVTEEPLHLARSWGGCRDSGGKHFFSGSGRRRSQGAPV